MKTQTIGVFLALWITASAIAQPPRKLPASLDNPPPERPAGPLSPSEAARQRDATIKALKEDIRTFDSATVTATQVEGRWQLRTATEMLKNFGTDRTAAFEAARVIKDLRINQMGTVAGAQPDFEYWLIDGKAPRGANVRLTIVPISARTIRAESVGGSWVVTDGAKGLYDFGNDADAAKRAATIFAKYGFNQIGVVGSPRPAMLYPLLDPRQASADKAAPLPASMPLSVASDVSRTSLLLPGNGYAGPKFAFDIKRLDVARSPKGEWTLTHSGDAIARFGGSEATARSAMKVLQDAKPTEMARIGDAGIPLFLLEGQAIHGEPLSVTKTPFRADRLKIQKLRDTFWLFDDTRPLLEVGSQSDAETMLRVIRVYDLKVLCMFGRPESGGLRLFTAGR
jgi:hypothetical protein